VFSGSAFDGRYLYLVPAGDSSVVARYDTQATFTAPTSWSVFDPALIALDGGFSAGFHGAIFDGRYVYLVPYNGNVVARYDTHAGFTDSASWSTFDLGPLGPNAYPFYGGAFDGRYLYFVPTLNSITVRYDTKAAFGDAASWSTFDTAKVTPGAYGWRGAAFDGRYVYFAPFFNESTAIPIEVAYGVILRYDTLAAFTNVAAWSTFDTMSVSNASAFVGAAFDGRYVYFVPVYQGPPAPPGIVARFDARTPPAMPPIPGFQGSFL
jgi:hypothetical protein